MIDELVDSITNFTSFDENTELIYSDVKKLKYFGEKIIKIDKNTNKRAKKGFPIVMLLIIALSWEPIWVFETMVKLDIHFAIYIQLGNYYS